VRRALLVALLLAGASPAAAQEPATELDAPVVPDPVVPPPAPAISAATVAGAPRPDQAGGVIVAEEEDAPSAARWIPRGLLLVPRWTFWAVMQPVRGAAWVYERYQVRTRVRDVFFDDTGTFGVYPVAFFETGFGLNIGARAVHRDLGGRRESLKLRASYGGQFKQIYAAKLSSGERFGRVAADLEAELHIRNQDLFWGIGNGDLADPATTPTPVDALASDTALYSRFGQRLGRVFFTTQIELGWDLGLKIGTGVLLRDFEDTDDLDSALRVTDAYQESSLVGFGPGSQASHSELELVWDTRRSPGHYLATSIHSTGWLASAYVGHAVGIGDDPSSYVRWGGDLQKVSALWGSSRILVLRLFSEGVTGTRREIPFVDLPRLGGPLLLRGYDPDRFRDRVAALGAAEYLWDLSSRVMAFAFVDAGRVFPRVRDVGVDDLRVGYGGGIDLHSRTSFMLRAYVASSIDGGLFINVGFDPVYDTRTRIRK
jgi:hypothetical protein